MLRIIFIYLLLMCGVEANADEFIIPPKNILKIAKMLSYPDFPTYIDILAVIMIESTFNPNAMNPEVSSPNGASNGLMQVQGGSFEIDKNIAEGTGLLRQYYKILGNREHTIRAYNIGIGRFKRGKAKISAEQYWQKFKKRRTEYMQYYK